MTTIHKLDPLRDPRWQALVDRHPQASVFHTTGWLKALRRTYGYRPVVYTTSSPMGELSNGLVFCRIRSWVTGSRMVSLPFSDHCQPLVDSPEELAFLVDCLQAEMEHQEWKYLEVRPVNGSLNPRRIENGFRTSEHYCLHRLSLRSEMGDIYRTLYQDSVQRRISRAERAGLVCECGRSDRALKDFYQLWLLTQSRHHLPPQPYAWFRNLVDSLDSSLEIRVAYKDEVPIAAILNLRFRDTIYHKYGCSSPQFDNLGAFEFLLWGAIRDSKTKGAEQFDLGRSKADNKGFFTCQDHWAGEHTRMMYWRYPGQQALGMKESWKRKAAKNILNHVPHRFLPLTGRLIYRHIG